ncbi:MAG TPA: MerR family transcriptional regulator [Candidatus Dormibacteraeota bacterium]|nr:MerR family transcriptional regulator [Candidatus Dormibacteraeota bacterium]
MSASSDGRSAASNGAVQGDVATVGSRDLGYKVGEAARMVGVSPATVRVWEREGLIATSRSSSGYRYFGDEELTRLRRVAYLRRVEKLNTAGIRRVLAEEGQDRPPARRREVALGPRLRRMRKERGQTLEQAAAAVGLSASFLSELERGQSGASMATLHRLLSYYGTTFAALLQGPGGRVARLKRAGRGRAVRSHGIVVEQLADGQTLMEPQVFTVEAGAGSEGSYAHEGEEFVYVLVGAFEVVLNEGERYVLGEGDSLYYPSSVAHSWRNPGRGTARVLWVNTPPTF